MKKLFLIYLALFISNAILGQDVIDIINGSPQNYHPIPPAPTKGGSGCTDHILTVPTYLWSFGCWPTCAAMIIGYYDRNGYICGYTGNINYGVAPVSNGNFFPQISSYSYINCSNPISASMKGLDYRSSNGHVDDFWVDIGHSGDDPNPWVGGNPPHSFTPNPCAADFAGTSQDWWNNSDGFTTSILHSDGTPNYDPTNHESTIPRYKDAIHGLRQYYESLGYRVLNNYNQYIVGQAPGNHNNGFTFENFKAEIDAGRPIIINLKSSTGGHSVVGIGYNDCNGNQKVFINDTWNDYTNVMNWGSTYNGYQQYSVSVFELDDTSEPSGSCIPTGPFDKVKIQDPPPNTRSGPNGDIMPPNTLIFSNGTLTSFYAQFTSYDGSTYPLNYDEKIELFYGTGTYLYAQQTTLDGKWRFIANSVPHYDWKYDKGNISGQLTVTANINDGDKKSDLAIIGIIPTCDSIITNTTFNSNATINGCTTLTLTNVTINNNASVTFNTNQGIKINAPFNVNAGSSLIINK
jgi:Peptidase_C39 like family